MLMPYRPEPLADFAAADVQARLAEGLARARRELGETAPLLIGGEEIGPERQQGPGSSGGDRPARDAGAGADGEGACEGGEEASGAPGVCAGGGGAEGELGIGEGGEGESGASGVCAGGGGAEGGSGVREGGEEAGPGGTSAEVGEGGDLADAAAGGRAGDRSADRVIVSVNPCRPDEIIGIAACADAELADRAVRAAYGAFAAWSRTPAEDRAGVLLRAAAAMRRDKWLWTARLMLEAGKPRAEADGETAEAIDFLEYYARQMLALAGRGERELTPIEGERNELTYIPLGVGVVLSPWNFPLAIMAGMTAAAVVAGNTVVLKPSSQTPMLAYRFVRLLHDSGLPRDVVQFAPGRGSVIGDTLAEHPLVRFVSFTGSREVGVRLNERVARVQPGQRWLKRYVAEMGGKDAIIVDRGADLELAASGIVASAFGYAGQKCSACSRAILHTDVYDELLERIVKLTKALRVGDVCDPGVFSGPVIDRAAYAKIAEYLAIAPAEGRVVTGGAAPELQEGAGYYLPLTVVEGVSPQSPLMREEIFGPVLAVARAADFEEALGIANDTEYGLTGAVYTRDLDHMRRAREEFHAGNLYINRKCTGALVGVHPFGGFNMSGTDSKAGGPDYLLLFTQPKLVSERL